MAEQKFFNDNAPWLNQQSGIDINPLDTQDEPEKKEQKKESHRTHSKNNDKISSPDSMVAHKYHVMRLNEADYADFQMMYISHRLSGGTLSFSAYMRHLIRQGFKDEPKDLRSRHKELTAAR